MRLGILTGGGDCPGLNAVLRAVARRAEALGGEVVGFLNAWYGVRDDRWVVLDTRATRGILPRGGTILSTSRGGPFDGIGSPDLVRDRLSAGGLDGLIVVGGNGSLTVAERLYREHGLPIVGVPKTIDNDVEGTDATFGFATAVQIATDAIDRLHSTSESHDRVMIAEVMGRDTGWIAAHAGLAGGAAVILVPERPYSIARIAAALHARHHGGRFSSVIVVAEGAHAEDPVADGARADSSPGAQAAGAAVADALRQAIGFECRVVVLGHLQRGGTPVAADRLLATRMGTAAVDFARGGLFGHMTALRGTAIEAVPLASCTGRTKMLDLGAFANIATTTWG